MSDTNEVRPVTARDYAAVEEAFDAAVPHTRTRRALLDRAGKALAAVGGGALLASAATPALAATNVSDSKSSRADSMHRIKSVLATFEVFGVTFVSEAVRRAPGTPSAKFLPVLKSANTSEYYHLRGLQRVGGEPIATRIWIPEELFGKGGAGLFQSIEKDEDIEISAYLVGVTSAARHGDAFGARLCAEALGTEAVHRALARDAQGKLGAPVVNAPNDRGFESFLQKTGGDALRALEEVGVGFGKKGSKPGKFYNYPGNPLENGTGLPLLSTKPQ
ncbi:hypothetical protein [Kribbella italica]|uniref:Ferritin-like domain-containing protein n=1 Tax=Kribbella italica TaxID=1540520 RepID=A0A7W9MU76_9ACTN|nr:hypothetical protein [Kribbella italica]MBB5835905.1 hypothetical protein [Kribbella italica]